MTPTGMPERELVDATFIRDFIRRWEDSWNSHDTDQILALLHPDVLWDEQVFWPTVLQGREAVRAYVDAIWRAMPGVTFEEVQSFVAPEDGRGLYMFCQRGGAPPALGDNGKTYEANGVTSSWGSPTVSFPTTQPPTRSPGCCASSVPCLRAMA